MSWIFLNESCPVLDFISLSIHNGPSLLETCVEPLRSKCLIFMIAFDKSHITYCLLLNAMRKKSLLHHIFDLIKLHLWYRWNWIFHNLNLFFSRKLKKCMDRFLRSFYTRFLLMLMWPILPHMLSLEFYCPF